MKLANLIKCLDSPLTIGDIDIEISEIKTNSNQVTPNSLFVCISGGNVDSHNFIRDIERYGAKAVVTERKLDTNLTQIIVSDTRSALSFLAREFYGCPDNSMKIVGITGTNGKTTTSHLLKAIFDSAKIKCGIIGTIGVYYDDKFIEADLTTPDPLDLFKYLAMMRDSGVNVVVMEVSAHALELRKTSGITFDVGVFTNLTQDHLDYFENMEKYKKAKKHLFEKGKCKYIVANGDDEFGREITNNRKNSVTYGIDNPADIFAIDIKQTDNKTYFVMNLFDKVFNISTHLLGKFNVYNILASCTTSAILGVQFDDIVEGIEKISGVEGRLEKVYEKDIKIYIDYAHTPDGLQNSITTIKNSQGGKLFCVFGCGGNRDKTKRDLMGEISGKYADFTVITTDNPRFEEPIEIINQIEKGIIKVTKNFVSIEDRVEAIKYAIDKANMGDSILVAGKGAEKYQDVLGIKHTYNDKDTIINLMNAR